MDTHFIHIFPSSLPPLCVRHRPFPLPQGILESQLCLAKPQLAESGHQRAPGTALAGKTGSAQPPSLLGPLPEAPGGEARASFSRLPVQRTSWRGARIPGARPLSNPQSPSSPLVQARGMQGLNGAWTRTMKGPEWGLLQACALGASLADPATTQGSR